MSAEPALTPSTDEGTTATIEPVPGVAKPDPILIADSVRRRFGGLTAVDVDHVEIQRGQITALIGPNGAGKTTFFNLLTGFDEPDGGRWTFEGDDLGGRAAAQGRPPRDGAHVPADEEPGAPVGHREHAARGHRPERREHAGRVRSGGSGAGRRTASPRAPTTLLERFRLAHMRDEFAGNLSGGQRKLLEMARALMTDPKLIMLDEPMAGVNPALKQSLLEHIKGLKDEGRTVLFVEHDMDMVQEISDWVLVMAEGQLIAEGTATAISGNQEVIDAYLGAHHEVDIGAMDEAAGDRGARSRRRRARASTSSSTSARSTTSRGAER